MRYDELGIYGIMTELRQAVFSMSKAWPKAERYALTDQVRRSSRGIGANLTEAWAKRRYPRHFVSKLSDALGETEETLVRLGIAQECAHLDDDAHEVLRRKGHQIAAGLVKMMRHPDQWCGPSNLVREEPPTYQLP